MTLREQTTDQRHGAMSGAWWPNWTVSHPDELAKYLHPAKVAEILQLTDRPEARPLDLLRTLVGKFQTCSIRYVHEPGHSRPPSVGLEPFSEHIWRPACALV